jgi:hypothetical protein
MRVRWDKVLIVWLMLMAAETAHGVARTLFLVPLVGDLPARQIGVFVGSLLILAITCWRYSALGTSSRRALLLIGILWVLLTTVFELVLGRQVAGLSWQRILSDYDLTQGGLMPFGLLFLAWAPNIARKLHSASATTEKG